LCYFELPTPLASPFNTADRRSSRTKMGAKSSKIQTIAVCGATGQQGGATVDALLALNKGFTIRALTRDPTSTASSKLTSLDGVQAVKADFDDPASLRAAFEGCDAVFAVTDFWKACGLDPFKELQQAKNLVDAAKATGVKHFVFSTLEDTRPVLKDSLKPITGPYPVPHFDAKGEATEYMKEQLPGKWTALYTSIFYENLLPAGGMAPNKQPDGTYSLFIPGGGVKAAWCTTEDIGGVAAAVIAGGPKKFAGKSIGIAGEVVTVSELAEIISKVSGKKVVAVEPPTEQWAEALTGFGVPELAAKDLGQMFQYYINGNKEFLALRPVSGTKAVYKGVQGAEAWLTKNKDKLAEAMK